MDPCTPPPSPTPHRDRTRSRRNASPRLRIRRRSLGERPSTPTQRPPSPELIFSMSPNDSHFHFPAPASTPKTQLNPGALFARARQQSASAFAALSNHQRSRTPLLYSFPKTVTQLCAPPTANTSRAEGHHMPCSPITESSDDASRSPEATRSTFGRSMPIAINFPNLDPPRRHRRSLTPAEYSPGSYYGSSDVEVDKTVHATKLPRKIIGFDTGGDSDVDSGSPSLDISPFRLERFIVDKTLTLDSRDGVRDSARSLSRR